MFSHLNKEQKEAVMLPLNENALILAGAGSGKTRVLTARIVHLLKNNIPLHSILAVTFTNKAAKEMLNRLGKILRVPMRSVWVGTFHGIAYRILKKHAQEAGLSPHFQIMDTDDQKSLIKRILKTQFAYLKEADDEESKYFSPAALASWISKQKEKGRRAYQVLQDDENAWMEQTQERVKIYKAYEEACLKEGVVDFSELLLRIVELFQNHAMLRAHYQRHFQHILIDEFQDINNLQFTWMSLWAQGGAKLFVVGDDDQSIYAFRGANVAILRQFQQRFHAQLVQLGQNYRSRPNILTAANRLIENNFDRVIEKKLWTEKIGGERVHCHHAANAESETEFVLKEIKKLHQEDGVPLSQIAILYRTNAFSRNFEMAFFRHKLKCFIYGGLSFFSREEIKHVLAYLHLVVNPDDDGAFLRIANVPKRGIGPKMLENLQDWAYVEQCSLFQMASRLNDKLRLKFMPLLNLIHQARALMENASLLEVSDFLLKNLDFQKYYEEKEKNTEKRTTRLENLSQFLSAVQSFLKDDSQDKTVGEIAAFLSYAALFSSEHQNAKGDAVQMMTVHLSKGLEFPYVFVVGLEEGSFPHNLALNNEDTSGIFEERRLFYVAMTRAEEKLYLTHAHERAIFGKTQAQAPSSFLKDLNTEDSSVFYKTSDAPHFKTKNGAPNHALRTEYAQNRFGQRLTLGDFVVHPKFGKGQIVKFIAGKNLGFVKIYFDDYEFKELDLNIADIQLFS